MGNAAIYYYPEADGPLKIIDLGEPLSDLQQDQVRIVDSVVGMDAEPSIVDMGGTHRIRLVLERFTGDQLVADLEGFQNHAQRGLPFGLTADTDHSFGAFTKSYTLDRAKEKLVVLGNVFFNWSDVVNLTVGDTIVIHSQNPEYKVEERIVETWSSTTGNIGIATYPTTLDFEVGPVFVRHKDFLPFCYLDPDQRGPILTHDHRITWTLDLGAVYSPAGVKALWSDSGSEGVLLDEIGGGGTGSLQSLIGDELLTFSFGGPVRL